jgi:hypothetical protein
MIKSVELVDQIPLAGGKFISVEIEHEDEHIEFLYFDEEELLNASALNEKGCLSD